MTEKAHLKIFPGLKNRGLQDMTRCDPSQLPISMIYILMFC